VPENAKARWTFMVYMAGYNSLSKAAGVDIDEMRKVGSSDAVQVRVFVKQLEGGAHHIAVAKDGANEQSEALGDRDSGDPQTVVDFVRWAVASAPAERYALVLWNHGSGWEPQDFEAIYSHVRGGDADTAVREFGFRANQPIARAFFTTTLKEFVALEHDERAICSDDGTGHSLDTIELGNLVALLTKELGRKLDLVGMDACLMSNLEVAYEIREHTNAVVGSEELEPNAGWPYAEILGALGADPAMDGPALAKTIVESYVGSYKNSDSQWPVTQCAVAAGAVDEFSRALDALSTALQKQAQTAWPPLLQAQIRSVSFDMKLIDLKSFCDNLVVSDAGDEVKRAATDVLAAIKPGTYVLAEGHLGGRVDPCGGVTVYFPAPGESISKYYADLAFAKAHGWDDFLQALSQAVRGG
jgi:hypothetical protein